MKYVAILLITTQTVLLVVGCGGDHYPKSDVDTTPSERVVFIYMAADNSLSGDADRNMLLLEQGIPAGGRMVIYVDRSRQQLPELISLYRPRPDAVVQKTTLKSYPEHNSASVETMGAVLADVRRMMPSRNYGLVLWSHGTGWLSGDTFSSTRAFGQDGASWMEISELAEVLPDAGFDFILFDACFMASIEALYPLRNKAPWVIASCAEVLTDGFPYRDIAPMFYSKDEKSLEAICRTFYDHYNALNGGFRTATVSLVRTSALEQLARSLRGRQPTHHQDIQYYDRFKKHFFFDMADAYGVPEEIFDDVIAYKAATPYVLYGFSGFPVNKHSGMTTYIMGQSAKLDKEYIMTEWYKATN